MLDDIVWIEICAFNTEDGKDPPEDNEDYQKYLKYGWMFDVLHDAYNEE
jgi:hypothetical protein